MHFHLAWPILTVAILQLLISVLPFQRTLSEERRNSNTTIFLFCRFSDHHANKSRVSGTGYRRMIYTITDRDNDPQNGSTDNGLAVATGSNGERKWIEKPYHDTVGAGLLRHTP